MKAHRFDHPLNPNPLAQQAPATQIDQEERVFELQLEPQRILQQPLDEGIGRLSGEVLPDALRLELQAGQGGLRVVRKRGEELLDLSMAPPLPPDVGDEGRPAADQQDDQDTPLPEQHPVVLIGLGHIDDRRRPQPLDLTESEDHPPPGERHRKEEPRAGQTNLQPIE